MTMEAQPLVKEHSATTGTGSYTLEGTVVPGFRRFQDAYTAGASTRLIYMARMGNDWEYGVGTLTAGTTLVRTLVIRSSNANAAVNWGAGTKIIVVNPIATAQGRHNLAATRTPEYTDDEAAGYGVGSLWIGSVTVGAIVQHFAYIATLATTGSILWSCIGIGNNFLPMFTYDTGDLVLGGVLLGNGDDFAMDQTIFGLIGTGSGGKGRWSQSRIHGLGYVNTSDYGAFQYCDGLSFIKETADATPTVCEFQGYTNQWMTMEPDSAILIEATLVARCHADNDVMAWKISAAVQRVGSGDPAIVGSVTYTVIGETAGAAAWDCVLGIDTTNDAPQFTVTGAAAKSIRWCIHAQVTQVGNN